MNEVFIDKIKNEFHNKRVIVIGDIMVDEYVVGAVSRISPEAPVPILNYKEKKREAGGASNVAHNLKKMGAITSMIGVVGDDDAGTWLKKHLHKKGIDVDGILVEEGRPTSIKTRYATKGQQLFRVDTEVICNISNEIQEKIIGYIQSEIAKCNAVVLSDYKKGVLNDDEFIKKIIYICNKNNVLVAIDSKRRNIEAFKNADFVKPNVLELEEAVNLKIVDTDTLDLAGNMYLNKSKTKALVVTRGPKGISVFMPQKERQDYAAQEAQVYDVTGAGDTVISTIILGMVSGLEIGDAVRLANLSASIVISKVGTSAVTVKELLEKINEK